MERNFGQIDPISALQTAALRLLRTEVGRVRKKQLRDQRLGADPDRDSVEIIGNLARSAATLTAELRKAEQAKRKAGDEMTLEERQAMVLAFLRDLPRERRDAVLAELAGAASDA